MRFYENFIEWLFWCVEDHWRNVETWSRTQSR